MTSIIDPLVPAAMYAPHFDNAFVRELPADPLDHGSPRQVSGALYSFVSPTPVAAPRVLAWSPEAAALLDMDQSDIEAPWFAQVFGGNALLPGMQAYAGNYGGHQFGQWAGQLGDGRAIALGELINRRGERWELQLKGAGRTPYSRGADGRAVLRSSLREFLCSEAMHHLGIATTRALSLVATGEEVVRDMFYDGRPRAEPGAVVCRLAPSFLRFGHFELPSSRGDVGLLRQLLDFTIRRDFPGLAGSGEALYSAWFADVCARTAQMVADWMRVGFVHGVMNTDNLSILGLTIDYGPYGWIDNYDPDWTPNTTDAVGRRYRYGQQPQVAWWNLSRLAGALAPLFADIAPLQAGLDHYAEVYARADREATAAKLGLATAGSVNDELMTDLRSLLAAAEVDMTLFFRGLIDFCPGDFDSSDEALTRPVVAESGVDRTLLPPILLAAFYDEAKCVKLAPAFAAWLKRYAARLRNDSATPAWRRQRMCQANPRYVLRNYLAQQAIDRAEQGDLSGIDDLLEVMRHPYDDQPGRESFAARRPDWARERAGCSMLSCSS